MLVAGARVVLVVFEPNLNVFVGSVDPNVVVACFVSPPPAPNLKLESLEPNVSGGGCAVGASVVVEPNENPPLACLDSLVVEVEFDPNENPDELDPNVEPNFIGASVFSIPKLIDLLIVAVFVFNAAAATRAENFVLASTWSPPVGFPPGFGVIQHTHSVLSGVLSTRHVSHFHFESVVLVDEDEPGLGVIQQAHVDLSSLFCTRQV